ncbi:MAG: HisA/HisF-related TIM barrel protein, partial [Myxococcota bacterium]|nr:HisA/HisF-related TIM barrel protein [Myxococcota bacterium]
MQVIPAIDLLDGKAVRLRQGRYDEVTVYSDDPAALAKSWAGAVERLHVVDLEGARSGRAVQGELVRAIVRAFGDGVQVGGGVRSLEAAESYLKLGVARVVLGTAAIRDPALVARIAEAYPQQVIVGVDARKGEVATDGWLEQSGKRAVDLVRELSKLPLAAVLYT